MTANGDGQVSIWADQTSNHFDVAAISPGTLTPLPTVNWPVLTPNAKNRLPALDWGSWFYGSDYRALNRAGPVAMPYATSAPRTVLAVVLVGSGTGSAGDVQGGIVFTNKLTNADLEMMLYAQLGTQYVAYQVLGDYQTTSPVVNYVGQWIVISWSWAGPSSPCNTYINGALLPGTLPAGPFYPDNGAEGFSIGYANPLSYTEPSWSGMIGEVLGYAGNDDPTRVAAENYLRERWAI